MTDAGLTHVAIEVADLQRSIDFYAAYGGFEVVHRREGIAWISDRTRPFALVLATTDQVTPLGPFAHLGVACRDRSHFDDLVGRARDEGRLRLGPEGDGGPAGTWAFLDDPDGNTFEISVGQSVAVAVTDGDQAPGPRRLPILGVMGSGQHEHAELSEPLGIAIARAGWHLLTGGGNGVMASTSRAFTRTHPRAGLALGILRGDVDGTLLPDYPNEHVEIPIATHLAGGETEFGSRNHLNVLTADVVLALPGSVGTRAE
ncbi:MAG: hypothetical protein GY895_18920, partial [Phycisphaera sp.]|nr:hypothetical protein [Phycisphaera sp.]